MEFQPPRLRAAASRSPVVVSALAGLLAPTICSNDVAFDCVFLHPMVEKDRLYGTVSAALDETDGAEGLAGAVVSGERPGLA